MKSLEEQLMIERDKYAADQKKKGFSEGVISTTWNGSVMVADTVEHKLSNAKKLTKGITEVSRKVTRNNGSQPAISEADSQKRDEKILAYMKHSRMTWLESAYMAGEKPGRDAKQPQSITDKIVEAWKAYLPTIADSDAKKLAEMGKLP